MRVVVHPAADAELAEAVAYYTAIDLILGQRFYLELTDHLWIVAVMHLKRNPGYWKTRLE